jgi:diaminopimelate decarboxylase
MNAPIDLALLPRSARIDAHGRMRIADCDLEALADEFGTPLFVYDEHEIRTRCAEYADAFGADGVYYASKAFSGRAIAAIINDEGLSIDVSTEGEIAAARRGDIPMSRMLFHGNNKSLTELQSALEGGIGRVVVDSLDELDRIEALVAAGLPCPRLLVRVTPGIEAHTHEYITTGVEDTKFGFSIRSGAARAAIDRIVAHPDLRFAGIHCHIGSQIFATEPFRKVAAVLADLVQAITATPGVRVEELNLGGGLGIAYTTADTPLAIDEFAEMLRRDVIDAWIARELGAPPRITVEPGRSIVGPAGVTLYRVGTIKTIPDVRTYVAVDGGMSDNIRHALYQADYEAFLPARAHAPRPLTVTIAGKHCEQGDLIATDAHLPADVAIGDVLCTPATGAYGYSMASNYNNVPRPAVVFVRDGDARVVLRRETVDDLFVLEP